MKRGKKIILIAVMAVVVLAGAMRNWKGMVEKAETIYRKMLGVVPVVPVGISQLDNAGIVGSAAMAFEAR